MRKIPFQIYAQILIFSALIALGTFILWPLQQAVHSGLINVRDDVISILEQQIGRTIQYSSISPSLFGSFDVRNVRIMGEDEQALLTMSRFRIAYSLFDMLRGRTQSIRSVQIDSLHINFNLARDHDLLNLINNNDNQMQTIPDALQGRQSLQEILPEKLQVRIRNGKCIIGSGGSQVTFDTINLSAEIAGARITLDGRWVAGLTIHRPIGTPVNILAAMRINGSAGTNLEEGDAVISISSITGDAHSSFPLVFGVAVQDGIITTRKMPDVLPLNISMEYGVAEGTVDAGLDVSNFRLRDFLTFSGALGNAGQLLDIAANGTASFIRYEDGRLGYSVDLYAAAPFRSVLSPRYLQPSFEVNAAGDEENIAVTTFRFSMPRIDDMPAMFYGNISFSGNVGLNPITPAGLLLLENFSFSGTDGINARIAVASEEGEISLVSRSLNLGQGAYAVELASLHALFRPEENDIGFSVSILSSSRPGALVLEGSVDSGSRDIDARIRMDSFSAGDLVNMSLPFNSNAHLPALFNTSLKETTITTEIAFSTDFSRLEFDIPRFVFAGDSFRGHASMSGTDNRFDLIDASFTMGGDTLLMAAEAEFTSGSDMSFSVNAHYRNLGYLIEGAVNNGSLIITGSHGLDFRIGSVGGGYTGSLHAHNFPLPFIGHPALFSLSARLNYNSADSWSMDLEQLEALNITGPAGLSQITISGKADHNGMELPQLQFRDRLGSLGGNAHIAWRDNYSAFNGTVYMGQGRESYLVQGSYDNNRMQLTAAGSSMRLDRLFGNLGATFVDGDLRLDWESIDSFKSEINISSVNGRMLDREFQANANVVFNDDVLSISGMHLNFAQLTAAVPQFTISRSDGTVSAQVELGGSAGERSLESQVALTARFIPVHSWLHSDEALETFSGSVNFNGFRYGSSQEAQSFAFIFSRSDNNTSLSGGPRDLLRLQMDGNGDFFLGLSNPSPVRGTVVGNIHDRMINARASDIYIDAAGLFNILPQNLVIYPTAGFVTASFDIRGPVSDPEFYGSARGTSLRFRVPEYIRGDLRPVPFTVRIEGNEMNFGPVPAAAGNGAGTVTGLFIIERWIPNVFNLDMDVPRTTPVPYEYNLAGISARGDASGRLIIDRETMLMHISGELLANNTELTVNAEEIMRAQGEELFAEARVPVQVDITVGTGPTVEFLYPSARFPIIRATPDQGTRIFITADSMTQQFTLNSDVRIRSGEIFYFERSFYIRSGMLVFRENEMNFEPRLTARAEARDRNDDGPVTISMIVDNAPLLSFTARFESSPPLSQMEILAMMGQGIAGSQMDGNMDAFQRALLSTTTDLFAQFFLVRQLEQQIRNFTRLDMFSVRTHVLQNFVFSRMGYMDMPVDRNIEVGNYFDNTTLFGGKYIGQDMFIQGMLSMTYDANRAGRGLTLRPDIGLELQNPLFSIRWDFVPTHPENWFVNDNSITLTWSRTF